MTRLIGPMIGWQFKISRQKWFKRTPARTISKEGKPVAAWSADMGGARWLDELVDEKKAICLQEGFYPGLYTTKAKYIFEVIQEKPPFVKIGYNWIANEKHEIVYYYYKWEQEIASCNKEEWLLIEIWDLS